MLDVTPTPPSPPPAFPASVAPPAPFAMEKARDAIEAFIGAQTQAVARVDSSGDSEQRDLGVQPQQTRRRKRKGSRPTRAWDENVHSMRAESCEESGKASVSNGKTRRAKPVRKVKKVGMSRAEVLLAMQEKLNKRAARGGRNVNAALGGRNVNAAFFKYYPTLIAH